MIWSDVKRRSWLLGALVLIVAGLLLQPYRAQQASRYALTAAIVERGTVVLDAYEGVLGVDRAVRDGHTYSDKAPGQPVLAVPFFALGKVFGIEDATKLRVEGNLGLWWVTLWSAVVPGVALIVMIHRRIRQAGLSRAGIAAFSVFFGTLLLPFSSLLFGHVLAAALLFGAYLSLLRADRRGLLVLGGLLAGLAVTVEYTAVLGVVVLGILGLIRHRWMVVAFVAGGLVPAVGLALYNYLAFGGPFVLSYQFNAFSEVTNTARPVLSMFSSATIDNFIELLFDGRGLLVATPIVLVALAGAVLLLRQRMQIDAVVAVAMMGVFVLLPIFWGNPWGGASPGARYLTPALPFLGVPLAASFERWPRLSFVASGISVVTMVSATLTEPIIDRFADGGLGIWVGMLLRGDLADSLLTIAFGETGWLLHGLAVLLLLVAYRLSRSPGSPTTNPDVGFPR